MANDKKIRNEKMYLWKRHIESWRQSELSQRKYCLDNNLNKNTFGYWVQRLKSLGKDNDLVEVNIKNPLSDSIELTIDDFVKIKVKEGFNPILLKKIIAVFGNQL